MNVYIGDRIENLDLNQEFIEFDEDVFYYILDIAEDLPTNIDVLSLINPEADTVISGEDLYSLVNILEYIIDDEMLEDYDDDVDEAIEQVELVLKSTISQVLSSFIEMFTTMVSTLYDENKKLPKL